MHVFFTLQKLLFLKLSSPKSFLHFFVFPAQQELCDIRKTLEWSKHSLAALLVLESLCLLY